MAVDRMQGVGVGIVTDVNDPAGLGRVKVNFPWLSDDNESQWARIATLMAGAERGSWFIPEVGDEALVAFEQGRPNHPYVVGFLWNGKDKPPNSDIDTKVRRLKTVSGHVLEFDDRSGKERVYLKTQGEHLIEMNDRAGEEGITIKTKGGQKIEMKDTPTGSINVETKSGQKVSIDDASQTITLKTTLHSVTMDATGVTVSAASGVLNITCLQANVTASSMLSVTAPFTSFSGVVQVTTLLATSVVSSTYTPGVGNLFGL